MKKLNLNAIRIDGGTQPREQINMEVVADYAEGVKVGIEFPPVVVFHDGAEHWLADGFHRWHAHKSAERASILADVRSGSLDDAVLYAASKEANGTHGLRRTNADKRACVLNTLRLRPDWSDNRVAEHVGVDHKTVASHRAAILGNSQDTKPAVRTVERAGKSYQQDTSRIGKGRPAAATPAAAPAPKPAKRELPAAVEPDQSDQLAEAQHTVTELAQENEALRDRLAVESMDASEEEKTQAAETIRELRALVKTQEAEIAALKVSRDTYMRESSELKKQCNYWRKKAKEAGAEA